MSLLRRFLAWCLQAEGCCTRCGQAGSMEGPGHEECLWQWAIK